MADKVKFWIGKIAYRSQYIACFIFVIVSLCKHSLDVFGRCSFCFRAIKATFLRFYVNLKG